MHALYQGIVGHPYNHTGRPYVHEWWKWHGGKSNLLSEHPKPRTPRQHGLWVIRDPLERYVSAYHSKVKCCASRIPPLRPCMDDTHDAEALVRDLLQLNGNATKLPCLPFRDFVDQLHLSHTIGLAGILNPHFKPQDLHCGDLEGTMPTYTGNIDSVSTALRNLDGFGLAPMPDVPLHLHQSKNTTKHSFQPSWDDVCALCGVAASEYAAMKLPLPAYCLANATATSTALPAFLNESRPWSSSPKRHRRRLHSR